MIFYKIVKKEKNKQDFFLLKINFEKKEYFSNLNKQISKLNSSFNMFSLKTSKICIYYFKIPKICSFMHLFKKWSKYAFV